MNLAAKMPSLNWLGLMAVLVGLAVGGSVRADSLSGAALVKALQSGGYILLMRHASSPRTPPDAGDAEPDNVKLERQLDETGRSTARSMGAAIKVLRVPIGEVWSSPTYRARETVRLAALPAPTTVDALGDGGQSMQAASEGQADWLRNKVAAPPRVRTDTIIVTHYPNIAGAFGQAASGLTDGEALVFHPNGAGAADLVGRIKIEQWPDLATLQ
jgi:phosphohistidine phosphatase SixA